MQRLMRHPAARLHLWPADLSQRVRRASIAERPCTGRRSRASLVALAAGHFGTARRAAGEMPQRPAAPTQVSCSLCCCASWMHKARPSKPQTLPPEWASHTQRWTSISKDL